MRKCFVCENETEKPVCDGCMPKTRRRLGRIVEVQHTEVLDSRPCGSRSPYWDYLGKEDEDGNERTESPRENPDLISTDAMSPFAGESGLSVGEVAGQLSGQQKRVFELYVQEGLTEAEIAVVLGLKKSTVRTHLQRVRDKYRFTV